MTQSQSTTPPLTTENFATHCKACMVTLLHIHCNDSIAICTMILYSIGWIIHATLPLLAVFLFNQSSFQELIEVGQSPEHHHLCFNGNFPGEPGSTSSSLASSSTRSRTEPLGSKCFLWAGCPSCHLTNSVKALNLETQSTGHNQGKSLTAPHPFFIYKLDSRGKEGHTFCQLSNANSPQDSNGSMQTSRA